MRSIPFSPAVIRAGTFKNGFQGLRGPSSAKFLRWNGQQFITGAGTGKNESDTKQGKVLVSSQNPDGIKPCSPTNHDDISSGETSIG
jgi:hypothetical protein